MNRTLVARFLVDRPIRPGMVRAILDTLTAQGGTYVPHLVQRSPGEGVRRITGARPARLLEEVGEGGTRTTFMRVAEARPQPVLTFSVSRNPRARPTEVALGVPSTAIDSSEEIDRLLGVCKGLYLFLESFLGGVGLAIPAPGGRAGPLDKPAGDRDARPFLRWANFFGPELVSTIGVARLLTSVAFIVEILPDGGIMLVTHPAPSLAESPEGQAMRLDIERGFGTDWISSAGRLLVNTAEIVSVSGVPGGRSHRKTTS